MGKQECLKSQSQKLQGSCKAAASAVRFDIHSPSPLNYSNTVIAHVAEKSLARFMARIFLSLVINFNGWLAKISSRTTVFPTPNTLAAHFVKPAAARCLGLLLTLKPPLSLRVGLNRSMRAPRRAYFGIPTPIGIKSPARCLLMRPCQSGNQSRKAES